VYSPRQESTFGSKSSFRIAFWAVLLSFGLTFAMAVPHLDSASALLQGISGFPRSVGQSEQIADIRKDQDFTDEILDAPRLQGTETTTISDSPSVLLGLSDEGDMPPDTKPALELPVQNVSTQQAEAAGLVPDTGYRNFDPTRLETRLQELLEKVDRLEQFHLQQFQAQQKMSGPDPEEFLVLHIRLSKQLEELNQRLQSFSSTQPGEPRNPFLLDFTDSAHTEFAPETKQEREPALQMFPLQDQSGTGQIEIRTNRDSLTSEKIEDESSPGTISLPRIIPNGTPW